MLAPVKTLVYRDESLLAHDPGEGHPENARRLAAVYRSLDEDPLPGVENAEAREATPREIERIHAPSHLVWMARTSDRARVHLEDDTATSPRTYEAALKAAGSTLAGVEAVVGGQAQGAFALVRPPGHHAERGYAKGFCLFNNVAIAAEHALEEGGLRRVLVLDPAVPHGDGAQLSFWESREVLYVSSHRYPFYPGTGAADEIGAGPGRGYTINLPLPESAGDADIYYLYDTIVSPILRQFRPELILVSAGFDCWLRDPLGGMRQTAEGFAALYALFRRWADTYCPGRMVCTLEGGYDPAGVVAGARAALTAMAAPKAPDRVAEGHVSDAVDHAAHTLVHELAPHWSGLADVRG